MADRTLTINHADGDSETYTINRDKFAGVREMSIDGSTVTVDHTAKPKAQSKETTFGGSKSITIKRDIEPLLSKVVGGASAAYSLRDLNDKANTSKVVRVRRESDNNERDFTAKEVSNGTLQNWTNAQVTPPLDLRELTATGRDGPIIEAAAAYSLRNLSESYTGSVVEVRRSSDDAEESFTANQVANGELVDYVKRCGDFTNSGFTTLVNNGAGDGFTATLTSGIGIAQSFSVSGIATDAVTIDFDIDIVSGSPSMQLRNNITVVSNGEVLTTSGSKSILFIATDSFNNFSFGEADVPSEFTVSNVRVSTNDGFVSKWYDQSGNDNHATQGTPASQPKIVDGGSLISGGIDFDGVNDGLSVSGQVLTSSLFYATSVMNHATGTWTANGQNVFGQYQIGTSGRFQLSANASNEYSFFANATDPIVGFSTGAIGTAQTLISINGDGSNAEIWRDGTSKATDAYSGFTPANVNFTIGIDASGDREFNGNIAEVIIYDSDQSDNRTAFEANIGETYGIDLPSGVDTGYDQVDGFVETWYDQSGNGNDATQLTAGNQPKIVDAGALVTGGIDFDGVNDHFDFTGGKPITSIDAASAFFVGSSDSSSNQCGLNISSSTSSRRFYLPILHSGSFRFGYAGSISAVSLASSNTSEHLFTGIAGTFTAVGYYDGELKGIVGSGTGVSGAEEIGSIGSAYRWDGRMREIIIYPSDQSANRPAIEANINNQYDIY